MNIQFLKKVSSLSLSSVYGAGVFNALLCYGKSKDLNDETHRLYALYSYFMHICTAEHLQNNKKKGKYRKKKRNIQLYN